MSKNTRNSTKTTSDPKKQKKLYIPREERYLRGVALMVICGVSKVFVGKKERICSLKPTSYAAFRILLASSLFCLYSLALRRISASCSAVNCGL